ncbi:MAG: hypothetical protein H7Z14_20995 [Anaerolineae bacterium]|nr:hypothetical protein [Phycisphaerae bacterium]
MTRQRPTISLEVIEIATPCTASWDKMRGNDRVRFCEECKLHVYDISAMTRAAATALVSQSEGRLCVQMYRRADGTVITDDCSAIRRAARRAGQFATAAASAVLCAALSPVFLMSSDRPSPRTAQASFMPMAMFESWIAPISQWFSNRSVRGEVSPPIAGGIRPPTTQPEMGDVAVPPATQPAQPTLGAIPLPPTTQPAQRLRGKASPSTQPAEDDGC